LVLSMRLTMKHQEGRQTCGCGAMAPRGLQATPTAQSDGGGGDV
jgi:hypothetical protein